MCQSATVHQKTTAHFPSSSEEKRINDLFTFNILNNERDKEFDDLATLASKICETSVAQINFLDGDTLWAKSSIGYEMDSIPRKHSFCDHTIRDDEEMIVSDLAQDDRFKENIFVANEPNVRFYAGVNIKSENKRNIGTICVLDMEPKELTEHQIESLRILAKEIEVRLQLRKTNRKLEESNSELQQTATFLQNSADLMFLIDPDLFRIKNINRDVYDILGYRPDELNNSPLSILKPGQSFLEELNKWASTDSTKFEHETQLQCKEDNRYWFNVLITKVDNLWYATARQIEKRKQIEQEHNDALRILQNAQRIAKLGNWIWYPQKNELLWSKEIHHLMGTHPDTFNPSVESFINMIPEEDQHILENAIHRIIGGGSIEPYEHRVKRPDGDVIFVTERGEVERNENGEATKVIGILQDITESKKTEEKIRESLREKEIMLSEIHHRVKNNLSVIIGMLQLEEYSIENLHAKEILNSIVSRLQSMALVHENLYQTDTFTHVPFDRLMEDLVNFALLSSQVEKRPNVQIITDEISLNINQAIPFSLAINQLIYLCFENCKCPFSLNLSQSNNMVQLSVETQNREIFKQISEKKSNSELFEILLAQFDGDYQIVEHSDQHSLIISFSKSDDAGSSAGKFSGKVI